MLIVYRVSRVCVLRRRRVHLILYIVVRLGVRRELSRLVGRLSGIDVKPKRVCVQRRVFSVVLCPVFVTERPAFLSTLARDITSVSCRPLLAIAAVGLVSGVVSRISVVFVIIVIIVCVII